jgi:hypothetical protein
LQKKILGALVSRRAVRPPSLWGSRHDAKQAVFLCFFALLAAAPALAAKTDIVTLVNGDRLTGEVVRLQRGLLEFKTDTMGTVQIEWGQIATLQSTLLFEVERASGGAAFRSAGALLRSRRARSGRFRR